MRQFKLSQLAHLVDVSKTFMRSTKITPDSFLWKKYSRQVFGASHNPQELPFWKKRKKEKIRQFKLSYSG